MPQLKPRSKPMRTVVLANQKGGVGKTTAARHLTFYAAEQNLRTLVVDFDPQANTTRTLLQMREDNGLQEDSDWLTAAELFGEAKGIPMPCAAGVSVIASDRDLIDVGDGIPLDEFVHRAKRVLDGLKGDYDICIVDTMPTLGKPLYAALVAATDVIMPCSMDQDAVEGLSELYSDINRVKQMGWNTELNVMGILPTCVNTRRKYDREALAQLREAMGDQILSVHLNERGATKLAKHRPVWQNTNGDSHRQAAKEMRAMCKHVFKQLGF